MKTFDDVNRIKGMKSSKTLKVHTITPETEPKPGRVYQRHDVIFIAAEGNVAIGFPPWQIEQMVNDGVLPKSCLPKEKH